MDVLRSSPRTDPWRIPPVDGGETNFCHGALRAKESGLSTIVAAHSFIVCEACLLPSCRRMDDLVLAAFCSLPGPLLTWYLTVLG